MLEILFSSLGNFLFQRRKFSFPTLETSSSSLGTKKFQEGNQFWNSYVQQVQHDKNSEDIVI